MPQTKRRRTSEKKGARRYGAAAGSASRAIVRSEVKKSLAYRANVKYHYATTTTKQYVATGAVTVSPAWPTGLVPGVYRYQYKGDVIRMHEVWFNFAISAESDGKVIQPAKVRVMIILDKAGNGIFPPTTPQAASGVLPVPPITNATDWLLDQSNAGNSFMSLLNDETVGKDRRYRILHDKVVECDTYGGATDQPKQIVHKMHMKFKTPIRCQAVIGNAATGVYSDWLNNVIYFAIYSNTAFSGGAGSGNPSWTLESKVRFTDE